MASDADWVEDVRRWVAGTSTDDRVAEPQRAAGPAADVDELGYEAAHPALQARHWPDAVNGLTG